MTCDILRTHIKPRGSALRTAAAVLEVNHEMCSRGLERPTYPRMRLVNAGCDSQRSDAVKSQLNEITPTLEPWAEIRERLRRTTH
jgi:hypothetical protein